MIGLGVRARKAPVAGAAATGYGRARVPDSPRKLVVLNQPITRRGLLKAGFAAALAGPLASACGPGPTDGLDGGGRHDGGSLRDSGVDDGDGGPDGGSCAPSTCTVNANTLVLPLAEYPELKPILGWNVYFDQRYTDPVCGYDAILVIQVSDGKYVALSGSCTHECCTVGVAGQEIGCPCHNSSYNFQGVAQSGPALTTGNLPSLPCCFDGCAVYVQLA